MISIVYCTREHNPKHTEHLIKAFGMHKHAEVIEIINNGEDLTACYNRGLNQAKNDCVVYCHDDILIESNQVGQKIIKLFEANKEFGIIGVAGTKYLSDGKWWSDKKSMYGKVKHTHEGKSWLSEYSQDQGNSIQETVIVDGVFFAVKKSRLKKTFNEEVKGFHFYDIDFCFRNYLEGVKVGVVTNIRINHFSIGQTNKEWDNSKLLFESKYKENLPVKIDKVFDKNNKLKVLIGCINFQGFTGSELYVFELAKELIKQNCEVTICSTIGNPLAMITNRLGIKMYNVQEPPGYKLGDGKWTLNTQNGPVVSQPNTLYKVAEVDFDVIHCNHKPITERLLQLYPDIPAVCSIHSEVIPLEDPVVSPKIKKYIAIREEIKAHINVNFGIPEELISVIYNPIDSERFKVINDKPNDKKRILFVGTVDYIRKNTIQDLINVTRDNNEELWIVGKKNDTYLDNMIKDEKHVSYFPPSNRVEDYIHKCDEVAGILLGRTTIEGWMCGKKAWIYDVDNTGSIISKKLHEVPLDIDKFNNKKVAETIIQVYKESIHGK